MKNMFQIKSLLLYITVMTLFSLENASAGDLNSGMSSTSSRMGNRKKARGKNKKNKKNLKLKKTRKKLKSRYPSSEVVVSNISGEVVEKALDKTQMPFNAQEVYESGMSLLEEIQGDAQSKTTIQVGNYYLEVPEVINEEEVESLITNLNHIVPLVMTGAINEQFNLNAIAAILNGESDYSQIKASNEEKVRNAIKDSDMYKLMEKSEVKEFIEKLILLELKTMINSEFRENKKSLWQKFKAKFRKNTIRENIEYFINNNSILNEVQFLQDINVKKDNDLQLSPKELYLIASTAYYMKKHKESFLESRLFDSLIHVITIPLKAKIMGSDEFELLNQNKHKEMRALYKKMLNLYGVKVSGIVESSSGKLILESTAYYYFMKFLKYGAAAVGVASTGALARGAYHAYTGDEKLSRLDKVKAGINQDINNVKKLGDKKKELSEWGSEKRRKIGEFTEKLFNSKKKNDVVDQPSSGSTKKNDVVDKLSSGAIEMLNEVKQAEEQSDKEKREKEMKLQENKNPLDKELANKILADKKDKEISENNLAEKNIRKKYLRSNVDFGLDDYDFEF